MPCSHRPLDQARIRLPPAAPKATPKATPGSQPDSPTGHWFQNTTPTRLRDVDSILARVSTLVAPAPIDPCAPRAETVLPPALAAQFSPLGRSASLLPAVGAAPGDTLCGVHIPPRSWVDVDVDATPFEGASPSPRRVAVQGGALTAFGEAYRPAASRVMSKVVKLMGVVS